MWMIAVANGLNDKLGIGTFMMQKMKEEAISYGMRTIVTVVT